MLKRAALLFLCLAIALSVMPAYAGNSPAPTRYFAASGHKISGDFLRYFDGHGGLKIFGYPITEEIQENGKTVQYFERSRFEENPAATDADWEVQLGLLGTTAIAGREMAAFQSSDDSGSRWYFQETQHSLGGPFLDFWAQNGYFPVFGFPISEEFEETSATDGQAYTVQYFERARFEYHPELVGTPYVIELGQLGREHLQRIGQGITSIPPAADDSPSADLSALELEMFQIINEDRAQAGVPPLRYDTLIASVARAHAQDMVDNNYHGHTGSDGSTPNERMRRAGVNFAWGSENYWTDRDYRQGLRVVNSEMMAEPWSPTSFNHIWNLLYTGYTRVGIGIVIGPNDVMWVVEDFADGE